jgi:fatty acid synthase
MLNFLDLYDMNQRMGKLKDITKFDGAFFGTLSKLGDMIDPHARILLETTYEAICDAGIQQKIKIFSIDF